MSILNKEIRAWWIEKSVDHNVPTQAVFEQFKPTVSKQGHEWIRVMSVDDFHKEAGMNVTRWVEVCQHLSKAIKALEFYADSDNWGTIDAHDTYSNMVEKDDLGTGEFQLNENTDDSKVAGKLARETLKAIKEIT